MNASSSRYFPSEFESKWSAQWEKDRTYAATSGMSEKNYILGMFPYPSGAGLHTGHARIFLGSDILARFFRMNGQSILFPMGWDAFGLPAENAAIKLKKNPRTLTDSYITNFKRQFLSLGISYDWGREINTTDPSYVAKTQWLFILFFKMGLLHKKNTSVFYCPSCKTALAQEEVLPDGTHERCGTAVIQKVLPQWIFRITKYADSLLDGLDGLDWSQGILEMQRNWIGKKAGLVISHKVTNSTYILETFTAYPAYAYADTFIVIAPEHPFVQEILRDDSVDLNKAEVRAYLAEHKSVTREQRIQNEKDKAGVFTGYHAIDPLSGAQMPIWIANFAVMGFGTGAIRCSAHDQRDADFAKKYNLELKHVVESDEHAPISAREKRGVLINSGEFTGREVEGVEHDMVQWMVGQGFAKEYTTYHLRDWIFSRQRYWGEPIPMIFCQKCADTKVSYWDTDRAKEEDLNISKGNQSTSELVSEIVQDLYGWFPLAPSHLPLNLPEVDSYEPSDTGQSPLVGIRSWVATTCPECGGQAERETDTMPNWAGSCWYFLEFAQSAQNREKHHSLTEAFPFELDELGTWLPVDWYIGGAEHAVLHLLYARFWMHMLHDAGHIPFREPFMRLRNVGMVQAEDGRKMSKSLGNVINPDDVVAEYGADALRVHEMFMAPFGQEIPWSTRAVQGSYRFLKRIWHIYHSSAYLTDDTQKEDKELVSELQMLVKKITSDIPDVKFNTPIAGMMKFLNMWEGVRNGQSRALHQDSARIFLQLLAPYAPYITEELWHSVMGETDSIHLSSWPVVEEDKIRAGGFVKIAVQVSGKVRKVLEIPASELAQASVVARALSESDIQKWIGDSSYRVIYIEGKILNFVLE